MIPTKLVIAGVVTVVLLAAGAAVWLHYKGILEENSTLRENAVALEASIDLKDQEIAVMQDQAVDRRERAERSQKELWAARTKVSDLQEKLARHDLGAAIVDKPEWLTKIMKRGTERRLRSIEGAANALQ